MTLVCAKLLDGLVAELTIKAMTNGAQDPTSQRATAAVNLLMAAEMILLTTPRDQLPRLTRKDLRNQARLGAICLRRHVLDELAVEAAAGKASG